jgi:hypothetical protein
MAQFSPPLIPLLTEKPTGATSGFQPDYLYLTRFLRTWSTPVGALCLRAPQGEGTVTLALISDEQDQPNEVLFKTELNLPSGKDSSGWITLVTAIPEPVYGLETFWIGFRFSASVELPVRLPSFVGKRTAATIDFAQLTGSLLDTAMEDIHDDDRLGLPILFPIFLEEVSHGA